MYLPQICKLRHTSNVTVPGSGPSKENIIVLVENILTQLAVMMIPQPHDSAINMFITKVRGFRIKYRGSGKYLANYPYHG